MSFKIIAADGTKVLTGSLGAFKSYRVGHLGPDFSGDSFILYGRSEKELREEFEKLVEERFAPKLNKMQAWLYGSRLNEQPREVVEKFIKNRRGCGNTTAHAMSQIVEAIKNPNQSVKLVHDHGAGHSEFQYKSYESVVEDIINKLGLKFMVIDHYNRTLTFEV